MDDLAETTDKYQQIDSATIKIKVETEKPTASFFLAAFDSLYKQAEWKKLDTFSFPERFGPVAVEKWALISPNDSLVAFNYQFSDSLKTRNAFFNWLDCFGSKRDSYVVGDQFRKQKRSMLVLVNNQQIVLMESNLKIPVSKFIQIFNPKKKEQNWNYVIEIPSFQKTNWYALEKGKMKIVENHENN